MPRMIAAGIVAAMLAVWAGTAPAETPVEFSKPLPPAKGLGTVEYGMTDKEKPFAAKMNTESYDAWGEGATKKYSLADQAGKYAGWFGIVRDIKWDEKAKQTRVLIEHKYFDQMTDMHIQVVSIYGAGDFTAVLDRKADDIPLLSLVAVYGTVSKGAAGAPEVKADYVRVWKWDLFTFMDYGLDQSNPRWVALRQLSGDDVYSPRPDKEVYEALLGKVASASKPESAPIKKDPAVEQVEKVIREGLLAFRKEMTSNDEAVRQAAFDRTMPDKDLMLKLFGRKDSEILWPKMSKTLEGWRKETVNLHDESMRGGNPKQLLLIDVRTDVASERFKEVLKIIPKDVPVYKVVVVDDMGTHHPQASYLVVDGKFRWFYGLEYSPGILRAANAKPEDEKQD